MKNLFRLSLPLLFISPLFAQTLQFDQDSMTADYSFRKQWGADRVIAKTYRTSDGETIAVSIWDRQSHLINKASELTWCLNPSFSLDANGFKYISYCEMTSTVILSRNQGAQLANQIDQTFTITLEVGEAVNTQRNHSDYYHHWHDQTGQIVDTKNLEVKLPVNSVGSTVKVQFLYE